MKRLLLLLLVAWLPSTPASADSLTLAVHLPSFPIEANLALADELRSIVEMASNREPELDLRVELFRSHSGLSDYVRSRPPAELLVLSESALAPWVESLGHQALLELRQGREASLERILVTRASASAPLSLAGTRGRSFCSSGGVALERIEAALLLGRHQVSSWFSIVHASDDDHAALADVLYGRCEVTLVAANNRFFELQQGRTLRQVGRSIQAPVPRVFAPTALPAALRSKLSGVLSSSFSRSKLMGELELSLEAPVGGPEDLGGPNEPRLRLLLPDLSFPFPPDVEFSDLRWTLDVRLPDLARPEQHESSSP